MKKIILLITAIALVLSLASCDFLQNQEPPKNEDPENLIYNAQSELSLVLGDGVSDEIGDRIWEAIGSVSGNYPKIVTDTAAPAEHEIVIGRCNREISETAYNRLSRLQKDKESDVGFLVYSDGASVALAYDEDMMGFTYGLAIDHLVANYAVAELIAPQSVLYSDTFDLVEKYKESSAAIKAQEWEELRKGLPKNADAIVSAIKSLYEIYDESMIDWMANLFDPDICVCNALYGKTVCEKHPLCGTAGFYFTSSARDTRGYMPDVESMYEVLYFLTGTGMTESFVDLIPEDIREKLIAFIYNLQEEDGFFYHPQWGKDITTGRKSRDFNWATSLLKTFGVATKYPTITDGPLPTSSLTGRLSASRASLVSYAVAVDSTVPDHLKTLDAFNEYLHGFDAEINTRSYNIGNTLNTQYAQIIARGQEYCDAVIDYLNSKQLENGLWHAEANYYGVNGLMKISGLYKVFGADLPRAELGLEAAIAAISSEENPVGIVDVWNPLATIQSILTVVNNSKNYSEAEAIRNRLYELLPEAIMSVKAKLALFLKSDGTFSYHQDRSTDTIQGSPAAVPGTNEGDLNGTVIAVNSTISTIYQLLAAGNHVVTPFSYPDGIAFLEKIKAMSPVRKEIAELVVGDAMDFEDEKIGAELPTGLSVPEGADCGIVESSEGGKCLLYNAIAGQTDYLRIASDSPTADATCYVFEARMFFEETPVKDGFAYIEMGNSGERVSAYRLLFVPSTDGIQLWDSSSTLEAKDVRVDFGRTVGYKTWFDLKIEYYAIDSKTARIKVYCDGELIAVSDNHYDYQGTKLEGKGSVSKKFTYATINTLSGYPCKFYVDDLHVYKTADTYEKVSLDNPFGYNADAVAEDERLYAFDDLALGASMPDGFVTEGSVTVVPTGSGKQLKASATSSVSIPSTLREVGANCLSVSFDLSPDSIKDGELATLSLLEYNSTGRTLSTFNLKATVSGTKRTLTVTEVLGGRTVLTAEVGSLDRINLRLDFYKEEMTTVFYLNGEMRGASSQQNAFISLMSLGRLSISAKSDLIIDNVKCERVVRSFSEETAPDKDRVTVSDGFASLTLSGGAESATDSSDEVLRLVGESMAKLPVNVRSSYTSIAYASLAVKVSAGDGEMLEIRMLSSSDEVFTILLTSDGDTVTAYERTALGTHTSPVFAFPVGEEHIIALEYYFTENVCNVLLDGKCVYVSSMIYSSAASELVATDLVISSYNSSAELYVDDIVFELVNGLYVKPGLQNREENANKVTFEHSGAEWFPSKIVGSLNSPAPSLEVVEVLRDGTADKALKFVTGAGGMDRVKLDLMDTASGSPCFVLDTDICFATSFPTINYELDIMSSSGDIAYRFSVYTNGGSVKFAEADKKLEDAMKIANVGEWFNLRIEYYVLEANGVQSIRVRLLVNGELIYTGVNPYASGGRIGPVRPDITQVRLNSLIAASGEVYLDNVSFCRIDKAYVEDSAD